MKEAKRQMHERLSTALAELGQVKPGDFAREAELGRDLSFRVGLPYFDRTLETIPPALALRSRPGFVG